ncbi:MAG: hypothetical protein M3063_08675 [Actinomycetota bacterium]|nr:hypothetical protein [Actinomycetota bacterium]
MNKGFIRMSGFAATLAVAISFASPANALYNRDPGDGGSGTGGTGGVSTAPFTTRGACAPFAASSTVGANYRVSLAGFYVKTQTYDTILQTDGKGDEVFLSYKNVTMDSAGNVLTQGDNVTATMGDTNGFAYREKAGSLSDLGGLQSEDCHHSTKTLWDGPLAAGQKAFITPVMWEWDGGGDAWGTWTNWASQLAGRVASKASMFGPGAANVISLVDIGLAGVASMPVGTAGDKQIGTVEDSTGRNFTPKMLTFDRTGADYVINNDAYGMGKGIVPVSYFGSNDNGLYTLYLRVQHS